MTLYIYTGTAPTCLPLKSGSVMLSPGKTAELPEDVDVVATLAAKRLLIPAATATSEKPVRKSKEGA